VHPILTVLRWHAIARPIGSYGAMLVLALLLGVGLQLRAAERAGLDVGAMISTLAGSLAAGFACAFATSLLVGWVAAGSFRAALDQTGIVFYGGALGGGCALALLARSFGLPVARVLDSALPALPFAHAVGRIGCLLGGCCYGAASDLPWAIRYTDVLAPAHAEFARQPWPAYEAIGLCALGWLFAEPTRFASRPAQRAALYVVLYAIMRALLEPLRADAVRGVFFEGTSTSQLFAAVTLLLAGAWLLHTRRAGSAEQQTTRSRC
jgi:phosphatidylglycerol:prolipoprotein diacylglycerol transferase